LPAVGERDHVLGAQSPALTLVEYGDFGCPHCFAAKHPIESLLERYDTVRLVWRHFPKPELHPGADLAAELSELAAESGRFWEAHALLLAGRQEFTRERLVQVAEELELDPVRVESTLDERSFRGRVLEDTEGGKRAGVSATPTFFLNGERLQEHWSALKQRVPEALAG
jgi:protein-disulfide isomerase